MSVTLNATEKLQWVRSKLMLAGGGSDPNLSFFCDLMVFPSFFAPVGTACTDGCRIAFDPTYIDSISKEQCLDLFLEETMHIALLHPHRSKGKNPRVWNEACDIAIWEILQTIDRKPIEGLCYIGPGCDSRYASLERKKTAEHYYNVLMKDDEKKKKEEGGQGDGKGQSADPSNGKGRSGVVEFGSLSEAKDVDGNKAPEAPEYIDGGTPELSENLVAALVEKAKESAKGRGNVSAAFHQLIPGIKKKAPDYREVLKRYAKDVIKKGANWNRPNKRLLTSGYVAPSRHCKAIRDIVCLIDSSGSISDQVINSFLNQIDGIYREASNRVVILEHDTQARFVCEWKAGSKRPVFVRKLRGGTCHCQPLEFIQKNYASAGVVICLTDGETRFPERAPRVPVVWVCTQDGINFPFGHSTRIRVS